MIDILNIESSSVINRGFAPLAAEAGLTLAIRLHTGEWGIDDRSLVIALKDDESIDAGLRASLNLDNLAFFITQIQEYNGAQVINLFVSPYSTSVPRYYAKMASPSTVTAVLDANPAKFEVTFREPLTNDLAWLDGKIHVEIYYDKLYVTERSFFWTDGVTDVVELVNIGSTIPAGTHYIRVLFLREDDDGGVTQSKFGPVAEFTVV